MNTSKIITRKNAVALLVALALLLTSVILYRTLVFRVTGTSPNMKQVSDITGFIDVKFNKVIAPEGMSVTSEDTDINEYERVNQKTLRIFIGELTQGAEYVIEITNVKAEGSGKTINKTLRFTAKDIPYEDLSEAQRNAMLKDQDKPDAAKDNPLQNILPHSELNYEIASLVVDDLITIHIKLILSAADVRINAAAAEAEYKKQALDYLVANKIDTKKYTITYETEKPSIY